MFYDKTVLITGATSTLGEQLIHKIITRTPKKIIIHGRNKSALLNIQRISIANRIPCVIIAGDLLDSNIINEINNAIITNTVNILIQCAGYLKQQAFINGELDAIELENKINYLIPVKIMQIFLNNCINNNIDGRIINILSLAGNIPSPTMLGYSASKSALKHFCDGLRLELEAMKNIPEIKIQSAILGLFESNMTTNIKKYKFVLAETADKVANSLFYEILADKENIIVGFYAIGANIINYLLPRVSKFISKKASPVDDVFKD